jgi:twitching motility protein PilT
MSFPADVQPSVRAQLADCLVAVCCQRLDYLSGHRVRVPRCEILLPTSGAKGTIRSGNLSQLANVLQSGGEEGMWTFERYQRWMDQVTDWVQPPPAAPLKSARPLHPSSRPGAANPARPPSTPAATAKAQSARTSPAAATSPADEVIEVPAEELDLASLAELAKKAVERKPPG